MSRYVLAASLLGLWVALAAAQETVPPSTGDAPATVGAKTSPRRAKLSSEHCAECHPAIVKEWSETMHRNSTLDRDPLFRVMHAKAQKVLGEKANQKCSNCHYPPWAGIGVTVDVPVEGVSCVVCHEIAPGHPDERLAGKRVARLAVKAPRGVAPEEAVCLRCHEDLSSPAGHPVCTTGAEADDAMAGLCVDCHMPSAEGPPTEGSDSDTHRSHRFPGSRDAAMLASAVRLSVAVKGSGGDRKIEVTVESGDVGHDVPTGTPMRSLVLRVEALDEKSTVIWRNAGDDPLNEDPKAVFQMIFRDDEGRGPVPPFMSRKAGEDRRLDAGGERVVSYPLPPKTAKVRALLEYHLAPAALLEAAGLPPEARQPRVIARAQADL